MNKLLIFISLLTAFSNLLGRDIILVTFPATQRQNAQFILKVLVEEQYIPQRLITLRQVLDGCSKESEEALLHLCITDKGEMVPLKIENDDLIKAFTIFRKGF